MYSKYTTLVMFFLSKELVENHIMEFYEWEMKTHVLNPRLINKSLQHPGPGSTLLILNNLCSYFKVE